MYDHSRKSGDKEAHSDDNVVFHIRISLAKIPLFGVGEVDLLE